MATKLKEVSKVQKLKNAWIAFTAGGQIQSVDGIIPDKLYIGSLVGGISVLIGGIAYDNIKNKDNLVPTFIAAAIVFSPIIYDCSKRIYNDYKHLNLLELERKE